MWEFSVYLELNPEGPVLVSAVRTAAAVRSVVSVIAVDDGLLTIYYFYEFLASAN